MTIVYFCVFSPNLDHGERPRPFESALSSGAGRRPIEAPLWTARASYSAKLLLSSIERPRTADEPISPNVESQQTVGCACNADPFALPDFVRRLTVRSEPQRAGLTEVDPVQPAINFQGHAQPSGAPRQVSHSFGAAISLHDRDAIGWLDSPDQDPRAHAGRLAGHVQHERSAVGQIDIRVSALEEERPIARGYAAIGVTRGIADAICLGLNDAAGRHAFRQHPHEHFADEKTSELDGIDGHLSPLQHARTS